MKTKTQLKNTNSKRSIAMKKSWAERRNSPGRKLAQERQAKKVTQRVNLISEFKDIGKMLADIGLSINEVRSMLTVPPPSGGTVAHSVEVSKRLDDYKRTVADSLRIFSNSIHVHVEAFEKRMQGVEFKLPILTNRVQELEQRLVARPNLGEGNKQGVWMDRAYVKDLEKKAAELAELKKPKGRK